MYAGPLRVAALVALDGPGSAFDGAVTAALAAGASADDIVEVLIEVGPTVGSALFVSAAPKVAMSLGYDVGEDLERLEFGVISLIGRPACTVCAPADRQGRERGDLERAQTEDHDGAGRRRVRPEGRAGDGECHGIGADRRHEG